MCHFIIKNKLNELLDTQDKMQEIYYKNNQLLDCVMSDKPTAEKLIDLRRCLQQRADVNAADDDGNTPLHLAVRHERVTIVKLLLKRGANVNARDIYGNSPLHEAVRYREMPLVKLLIERGADVNEYNLYGNTPLHEAARAGDMSVIVLLLNNGANINVKIERSRGFTPLHVAAQSGLTSVAELLLNRGADVHVRDRYGSTALHEAASSGERSIVELLLDKGVEVNDKDQFKFTPLHSAAGSRMVSVVELLLNQGADVNAQAINGDTPLHRAARSGDISVVNLLLKKNAEVNPYTINGNTPLHEALRFGEMSVAELLLNRGAKVNVHNINKLLLHKDATMNEKATYGCTPLHLASRSGNTYVMERLLNEDADVNSRDVYGKTPLYEAAHSKVTSAVELLLNKGADVNAVTTNGNTLLHVVVAELGSSSTVAKLLNKDDVLNVHVGGTLLETTQFEETIVKLLLNKGAKINAYNEDGNTPLHLATELGLTSVVGVLLYCGADMTVKDKYGYTVLHKAARYGKMSVVELLLNNEADVNSQSEAGNTPLHYAVRNKQTSVVDLLLSKDADLNTRNRYGETPLHWAAECGLTSIVEQLVNKGANLNVQSWNGFTPLHEAARCGKTSTVKLLLSKSAGVNSQTIDGESSLHLAVRHNNINLANLLIHRDANVMLTNMAGETPLSYALLFFSKGNNKMLKLLQTAEKETSDNGWSCKVPSKNPLDIFQNNSWDAISMNYLQNNEYKYMKANDTSGLLGQLYETKMISLVLIRLLNHEQIEHDFFLGTNIDGIGAMDDICLRYRVRGQQRPVLLFIQLKHKKYPGNHRLTDEVLWGDNEDFSLRKYFKSYLLIKELFHVRNEDPMFEGEFKDMDCYFILYTSAKEKIIKKNRRTVSKIVHDIINTRQNSEPFQYSYDEADINTLNNMAAESVATQIKTLKTNAISIVSRKSNAMTQGIDFLNRFWIYPCQAKEDEVESKVKDEINKHYNNHKHANNYNFELHTDVIFLKSHDNIQKWWMLNNVAPYLTRSDDVFRLAKLECLDNVMMTIYNAIIFLQLSIGMEFYHRIDKNVTARENVQVFNTVLCRLFKILNSENKCLAVNNNIKNNILSLLLTNKDWASQNGLSGSEQFLTLCDILNDQDKVTINDMDLNCEKYNYSKRAGTSEIGGTLFRTKMLNLIDLRALNHQQLEQYHILGTKIHGISVMSDICLRCQDRGQHRPIIMFLQLIHREDPEKGKLTDKALWNSSCDFNLKKYFKSYLMIKECFRADNNNGMFEGDFCNVDCYFILYTSAKESLTKKKTENGISKVVQDLISTGHNLEPFQYDYDEADIECLTKETVMDQMEKLGAVFLKTIIHEKFASNVLSDELIAKYHVAIGREILQQCEAQPPNEEYRLWQFRSEFFDSDIEHMIVLKKAFLKFLLSKRPGQKNIINEYQHENSEDDKEMLKSLKFKLPRPFGNLDMTFSGSKAKVEKRIKAVADKVIYLLKINKDTKVLKINDDDVGPGKIIERGYIDVNGGIGGAVGNLLIFDANSNMLKFDLENKSLPPNASLFLKQLKDDRHKPYNNNLSDYRIKVNVNGFPNNSFNRDEYCEIQARDFLNKFWFYTDQAKENELERMLVYEINKKYSENKIIHRYKSCRNYLDLITLLSHDVKQKWWMQTNESPYLSRASARFECIELAEMYNLLQTVINYMYISKIYSIDIKVNRVNEKEKQSERILDIFQKIVDLLFKLFDPQFNEHLELPRYVNNIFERPTFCLKIHQEMKWVALTVTSIKTSKFANVKHCFVAKAGPAFSGGKASDGFKFYELYVCGRLYRFRDCFKNSCIELSIR